MRKIMVIVRNLSGVVEPPSDGTVPNSSFLAFHQQGHAGQTTRNKRGKVQVLIQ